ncbi:gliding motility-associated protein GldE [uncultured Bacteroides sp.]|uniref:gliding motility-associated protein GldE n=1 Tax=uncultured Bacteroides sp. TaxID=162156 RepID=UPI00258C470F|nr:gliding motility-associated protein GldE [uncultured Bacteroides sp.]
MDPDSCLLRLSELCDGITVMPLSLGAAFALFLALVLLYVSGFVSASEIAFFSLSPSDLNEIEEENHPSDAKIRGLLDDSERLLATILISNNFVNVTIIMLLNYVFASVIDFGQAKILEFLIVTVVLTFLLLLFGEIMPKIYSAQHTLPFARKAAPVITVLRTAFWPVSSLLVRSSFFINRFSQKKSRNLSVNELSQALELTDIQDTSEESNMLEGIIRFGEETAKEVMTSRLDIVDLDIESSFSEVLKCINENGYSRIPVYEETRDCIKGILYIKDLLPYLDRGDDFKWQNLIRPALFVPENKMIGDLLRDFQANKIHIAVVVDEFGGTSGIVTMEDIIEEIVGEINDEYDEEEHSYVKLTENVYVFEGKTLLSDFYKIIKDSEDVFDKVSGDADSLAGLLLELKGEFPALHEIINYMNYRFEILEMNSRRILKVKVTILPSAPEEDKVDKEKK